jgi:hypothetical protein
MSLRSEYDKVRKKVKNEVKKALETVQDVTNNILEGKEYRAEECFKAFKENNVQIVSQETGQEVTHWKDFGARIDRKWTGNYDLKFCKEEFADKGFIPKDEYKTAPLHTFDINKCFELFSEQKKSLYYRDKWFPVTQQSFDAGCKNSGKQNAPFCDAFSAERIFTEDYTLEACEAEFTKSGIFLLSDHVDL